jgi:Flp pilus assembly protein TadB
LERDGERKGIGFRLKVIGVNDVQANVQIQDLEAQAMDQARMSKMSRAKGKRSRQTVFQDYQQRGQYRQDSAAMLQRPTYAFPTSTTTTTTTSSSEPMEMDDSNLFTNEES